MATIRVVLVDDSSLARGLLRSFLEGETDIEVVGEAANGREAVDMARELRPSVISMDLEMPLMGGLDAIAEIMATKAAPILVVSDVADAQNACEAIRRGALDVMSKPEFDGASAAEFVAKLRMLSQVPVITHLRSQPPAPAPAPLEATASVSPPTAGVFSRAIAIASSTGGPQALAQILPALPADFPCPLLIAQHISDGFAAGMAEWLGGLCRLPVRLGTEGEPIRPGVVYVSPAEAHMAVTAARTLTLVPRRDGDLYHPSCDVLLKSVAAAFGRHAIGVILTGMGHDGAAGLEEIRKDGGTTIAQDEASSVIYGMNGVAVAAGAAQRVLPVTEIAAALRKLTVAEAFSRQEGSWA